MRREMQSKSMSLPRRASLHSALGATPPSTSATSSSGENLDQDDFGNVKENKRKKFHPFRAVRKIFRWGSKVKRVKCPEGVPLESGVISKKSLSVGELRQVALDPMERSLDADTMDVNDQALGNGGILPQGALYSMGGLSLSHDSVFSPDTSTPAEMGQIIHPVPVMTGISITNSLFKNELFNRVRARRAGEDESEDEDEDPGLPRSPCSHTPPNASDPDGQNATLMGSILNNVSSPGNKTKARSTCSAGSLSSMLSSETDEDSLSASASNSQNSSAGGGDKGGQLSHNAALHKIAIKPKKNHQRKKPLRSTHTEPSLPATPEERITPISSSTPATVFVESPDCHREIEIRTPNLVANRPMSMNEDFILGHRQSPVPEHMLGGKIHISDKRRSAYLDETPPPEPVIPINVDDTPKRKPPGGVAMVNVQAIQEALSTSRSIGNLVQRSKSMKTESPEVLRIDKQSSPSKLKVSTDRDDLEKSPLSAQNSPVKQRLNASSDFFQRSRSFSAKVSETHQALAEGKTGIELNKASKNEVVVDVKVNDGNAAGGKSLERRKPSAHPPVVSSPPSVTVSLLSDESAKDPQGYRRREIEDENCAKRSQSGSVAERPRSELIEGVELRRKPKEGESQTAGTIACEPELFKVFARRSLKQKPGSQEEKQDLDSEKEQEQQGTAKLKQTKVGDAKRPDNISTDGSKPFPATISAQPTPKAPTATEKKNSPRDHSKIKPPASIAKPVEKKESGPASLPAFRRETVPDNRLSSKPQDISGPKSLHADKSPNAVQRSVPKNEENIEQEQNLPKEEQPEWLRLAQKKRENRELKEKLDTTPKPDSKALERPLKKLISQFNK